MILLETNWEEKVMVEPKLKIKLRSEVSFIEKNTWKAKWLL